LARRTQTARVQAALDRPALAQTVLNQAALVQAALERADRRTHVTPRPDEGLLVPDRADAARPVEAAVRPAGRTQADRTDAVDHLPDARRRVRGARLLATVTASHGKTSPKRRIRDGTDLTGGRPTAVGAPGRIRMLAARAVGQVLPGPRRPDGPAPIESESATVESEPAAIEKVRRGAMQAPAPTAPAQTVRAAPAQTVRARLVLVIALGVLTAIAPTVRVRAATVRAATVRAATVRAALDPAVRAVADSLAAAPDTAIRVQIPGRPVPVRPVLAHPVPGTLIAATGRGTYGRTRAAPVTLTAVTPHVTSGQVRVAPANLTVATRPAQLTLAQSVPP
jgi:hypothetical protein